MKEIKFKTDGLICIEQCPYGKRHLIGGGACVHCTEYVKNNGFNSIICKGDELYINKKGISQNKGMVMESKNTDSEKEKDPKKVIAALRGEITKKNKRILRLENIINDMADKIDEKSTIIQDMNRFYNKRNIFQRIFNKHYEK